MLMDFLAIWLQYVDPVLERLDQKGCIRFRLSRAATKYVNGKHFRVLSCFRIICHLYWHD